MAQSIINLIPRGKANAIHLPDLAARAGLTQTTTKAAIRQARRNNVILSAKCGYWLPESEGEGAAFVRMMTKAAKSRFVTIKHTRQQLKKNPEQITLNDLGVV